MKLKRKKPPRSTVKLTPSVKKSFLKHQVPIYPSRFESTSFPKEIIEFLMKISALAFHPFSILFPSSFSIFLSSFSESINYNIFGVFLCVTLCKFNHSYSLSPFFFFFSFTLHPFAHSLSVSRARIYLFLLFSVLFICGFVLYLYCCFISCFHFFFFFKYHYRVIVIKYLYTH